RTDVAMRLIPLKLFLGHGSLHLKSGTQCMDGHSAPAREPESNSAHEISPNPALFKRENFSMGLL
ncbi:MAG: hypothetical protein ACOYLL_03150, partial [Beijerinckiaceae bacterium]